LVQEPQQALFARQVQGANGDERSTRSDCGVHTVQQARIALVE
jgi:hypothetical protein